MEGTTFGPGASILTIAVIAGWVAVAALVLRVLFSGIKAIINNIGNKEK